MIQQHAHAAHHTHHQLQSVFHQLKDALKDKIEIQMEIVYQTVSPIHFLQAVPQDILQMVTETVSHHRQQYHVQMAILWIQTVFANQSIHQIHQLQLFAQPACIMMDKEIVLQIQLQQFVIQIITAMEMETVFQIQFLLQVIVHMDINQMDLEIVFQLTVH